MLRTYKYCGIAPPTNHETVLKHMVERTISTSSTLNIEKYNVVPRHLDIHAKITTKEDYAIFLAISNHLTMTRVLHQIAHYKGRSSIH